MEVPAALDELPLLVRAGSIVPLGPEVQYSTEKPADPLEIRLYPGAPGSFDLYEDDGVSAAGAVHSIIALEYDGGCCARNLRQARHISWNAPHSHIPNRKGEQGPGRGGRCSD